jgi:hypothetical protein
MEGHGFYFTFCYLFNYLEVFCHSCLLGLQFRVFTNLHILFWPHGHQVRAGGARSQLSNPLTGLVGEVEGKFEGVVEVEGRYEGGRGAGGRNK